MMKNVSLIVLLFIGIISCKSSQSTSSTNNNNINAKPTTSEEDLPTDPVNPPDNGKSNKATFELDVE